MGGYDLSLIGSHGAVRSVCLSVGRSVGRSISRKAVSKKKRTECILVSLYGKR